jgi:hypothetical protein
VCLAGLGAGHAALAALAAAPVGAVVAWGVDGASPVVLALDAFFEARFPGRFAAVVGPLSTSLAASAAYFSDDFTCQLMVVDGAQPALELQAALEDFGYLADSRGHALILDVPAGDAGAAAERAWDGAEQREEVETRGVLSAQARGGLIFGVARARLSPSVVAAVDAREAAVATGADALRAVVRNNGTLSEFELAQPLPAMEALLRAVQLQRDAVQ